MWILLLLFIIVVSAILSLRFISVQNYVVQKVTDKLSQDLDAVVKIDSTYLEFFDVLKLEGIYIEDKQGDTLLYCEKLTGHLDIDIFSLINNDIRIKDINLKNTILNLNRQRGNADNNLKFLIDYFSNNDTITKDKRPMLLDIKDITLDSFWFRQVDLVKGETMRAFLPRGEIAFEKIDLPENHIQTKAVLFKNIDFQLDLYQWHDLPDSLTTKPTTTPQIDTAKKEFVLDIANIKVIDSRFRLKNQRKEWRDLPETAINFEDLDVLDININTDNFNYKDWEFQGDVKNFSLREKTGFECSNLAAKAFTSPRRTELTGLLLETPYSTIGDTLILKYRTFKDFLDFNNKVIMDARFNDASTVSLKDVMAFAPALEKNAFFRYNKKEEIKIKGNIRGKVSRLKGKDIALKLADGTILQGEFRSRDLNTKGEEYLDLELTRLKTTMKTLRLLIPNFSPPKNFDKLTTLDFNGRFTGFFVNFVADGYLVTPLGKAKTDIQLDLINGRNNASYSGNLDLIDFDLAKWTGNSELGKATFKARVFDGKGLTGETINTALEASVKELTYKDYVYRNLDVEGYVRKRFFEGEFSIKDDNMDLLFDGTIDFNDSIPIFDFKADINKLALQKLNLIKKDYELNGQVNFNFSGNDIANVQGEAFLYNFNLKEGKDVYHVDTLEVYSKEDIDKYRTFRIHSDIVDATLEGRFELRELPDDLLQFAERNYTRFANQLNLKSKKPLLTDPKIFDFDIQIKDSKNFTNLLDSKIDTLKSVKLIGHFDNIRDSLYLEAEIPFFQYDNVQLKDVVILADALKERSHFDIGVYHTSIGQNLNIPITAVYGDILKDTIHFNVNSNNFTNILDNLNLQGKFFLVDNRMQVTFLPSDLVIYNDKWNILEDNFVRFGKKYLETKNFRLTNKEKLVLLESIDNKGISLKLQNIDVGIVNDFAKIKKLKFGGRLNTEVQSKNIFQLQDFVAIAKIDTLFLNQDDWGQFKLTAETKNLKNPLDVTINLDKDDRSLLAKGNFTPGYVTPNKTEQNYFDFDIIIKKYPVDFAEYFLSPNINNTVGFFDANLNLKGVPKTPNIDGTINIYDGATTITYLNTRYSAKTATAKVSNYSFDLTGTELYDRFGNTAIINGGIIHNRLRDWGLNARVSSPKFLFLETTKENNSLYYGTALGRGEVNFTGSFRQANIYINATSGEGTKVAIPIYWDQEGKEVSFIKFNTQDTLQNNTSIDPFSDIRGVNVDMDLSITPEAEIQLIFDEVSGDIIKGNGFGNIQIKITRTGDFTMNGEYIVEEGEYLFTLPIITDVISLNKPFKVKRGGTIIWEGDPLDAQIDLIASYQELKAPIYPFIEEYIVDNDGGEALAKRPTEIDLTLLLKGSLLKPDINFDMDFPSLSGRLKVLAETKLTVIKNNQDDLNRQVALLMLTGQFIPSSETALASSNVGLDVSINTLSEFVSNQLSMYLTDLLSEVIPDIDLNINYRQYSTSLDRLRGQEIEIGLTKRLLNDRININLTDNFGTTSDEATNTGTYYGPEFILEYLITEDGRFKLRLFKLNDQDLVGTRIKWGAGIKYSIEFDSFRKKKKNRQFQTIEEFLEGVKEDVKETEEKLLQK